MTKTLLEDKQRALQKEMNDATNEINEILNELKFELEDE
jgi:hypothetical protein